MAETLETLTGEPVETDGTEAAFAAAMAAPPSDRAGLAAPPRRPPEPAPDAVNAPFGWTYNGGDWRPKQAPGRPRGVTDKARTTTTTGQSSARKTPPKKSPGPASSAPSAPARDYRRVLAETAEGVWFLLATAPVPDELFGRPTAGLRTRLRVQAGLIADHRDAIVNGANTIAAHNTFVARALDRLAAGEGGLWVLPACMMLAPFAAATAQLWAGKLADDEQLDKLAAATEEAAGEYLRVLTAIPAPAGEAA